MLHSMSLSCIACPKLWSVQFQGDMMTLQVTSRARALKALGDQRTNERVNRGDQVPGVTHVMVEWGVDEYHLVETVTERLRSVSDAVR